MYMQPLWLFVNNAFMQNVKHYILNLYICCLYRHLENVWMQKWLSTFWPCWVTMNDNMQQKYRKLTGNVLNSTSVRTAEGEYIPCGLLQIFLSRVKWCSEACMSSTMSSKFVIHTKCSIKGSECAKIHWITLLLHTI